MMPVVDTTRPFEPMGMTARKWLTVQPERVRVADLVFSQAGVTIEGMLKVARHDPPIGWDRYPHVAEHKGRLYLVDGHCRMTWALMQGKEFEWARVKRQ